MKLRKVTAFSLIELSIVILVIGVLIAGVIQGSKMISKAALSSARTLTGSTPVASIRSLSLWFESTSKASFIDSESDDNLSISKWYSINPSDKQKISANQNTSVLKPKYISNAINNLPAVQLDGLDDYMSTPTASNRNTNVKDSFSVFVVAQAKTTHGIDSESTSSTTGISGQKYLISPVNGGTSGSGLAGAGISMGTNGISFYEHSDDYMPPLLVYSATLTKPLVLLMEYNKKKPNLYINGRLVRTGLTSTKNVLPPSITIGGSAYGVMSGYVAEVIVFNEVLKANDREYVTDYLKKKWGIK